jgi:fumarate reductase iron-sulfur subunit
MTRPELPTMTDQAKPRVIEIESFRYDPQTDSEPRFQTYQVPFTDDMSVLQGLQYIKDHLDGTLTFRWSCRMAICGSCGMMINGVPDLSCHTFLREYFPGKVRVEPLSHFPVIRDLVVDQNGFLDHLEAVKPYLIPKEEKPISSGAHRQTPQQMDGYYQYSQCINCLLCYSACPQFAPPARSSGSIPTSPAPPLWPYCTDTTRILAIRAGTPAVR